MSRISSMTLLTVWVLFGVVVAAAATIEAADKRFRVLHIMSYHTPWEWTEDQFDGFREPLQGLDIEYKVFEMDTKRRSSDAWKERVGREARDLIDAWKPDLVYTNDDYAQQYVTRHYLNREIPFVFSGVNADPEDYHFVGSRNVTGVLEQEHFVETVRFLRQLVPGISRIAVIVDDDPTWTGVVRRMQQKLALDLPDIEIAHWDVVDTYSDYRQKIRRYQDTVDAVGLLGIHAFKDHEGNNVPWQTVLRWTAENSILPDFSFWKDRVRYGTLCVVYVSGYQQGLAAGRIARGILADGKKPSDFPMVPTVKGQPIMSLARARQLGISVDSTTLLTVKVVQRFAWDQ